MGENTQSIIQVIQRMVQENESEERIISTLTTMGVSEDQAKRLLLIAQADTFTLLSSEISKIVQTQVDEKKAQMENEMTKRLAQEIETKKKEISTEIEKEFLKNKTSLSESQKQFQDSVKETISKIAKLNEDVYTIATENQKMIQTVEKDLTETKLKGIKVRRSITRNALLGIGILMFLMTIVTIVMSYTAPSNLDQITTAIILALIGTALIYLSSNI
jgi:beta-xylosidase